MRLAVEQLRAGMALFFAEELDINLLAKLGYQGMPKGEQVEGLTPGTNAKRSRAGALDLTTGTITPWVWDRKQPGLFLERLATLARTSLAPLFPHLTVVVANATLHKAKRVQQWGATQPRFALVYLPTSCPDANPLERAVGDVHDQCTRTHTRNRIWPLVGDGKQPLRVHGPGRYALAELYDTPEVTAAVNALKTADRSLAALSQLAA
jgi:hypothetical protein